MILELLDGNGFKKSYNFVYVPHDFKRLPMLVNVGYFFINFTTHGVAVQAWDKLDGFKAWRLESNKVLRASWAAKTQGLAACIHRYKDSPVLRQDMPFECKPMRFENGQVVQFDHSLKLQPSQIADGRHHGKTIDYSGNARCRTVDVFSTNMRSTDTEESAGMTSSMMCLPICKRTERRNQSVSSWHCDTDLKIVVKNTFIDFEPVVEDLLHNVPKTCMARFSVSIPSFFPELLPKDADHVKPSEGETDARSDRSTSVGSSGVASTRSASGDLEARSLFGSDGPETTVLASVGAKLHGHLGEDGRPLCQPCGWFFKSSGCKNAISCNYCHLCPQGTFKERKRVKFGRLRAEHASDKSGEKTADAASAAV